VDKVTSGQVSSEYFDFPSQSGFHELLHNHHHLSSGAAVPIGLSPTPPRIKNYNENAICTTGRTCIDLSHVGEGD
jgi:hypothetical protein